MAIRTWRLGPVFVRHTAWQRRDQQWTLGWARTLDVWLGWWWRWEEKTWVVALGMDAWCWRGGIWYYHRTVTLWPLREWGIRGGLVRSRRPGESLQGWRAALARPTDDP